MGGSSKTTVTSNTNASIGPTVLKTNQTNTAKMLNQSSINNALIGQKLQSLTLPFLLTFEVFNNKLHNCLVDSRASTNIMPYTACQKLNAQSQKCTTKIVNLDMSIVQVMGEIKDVLIRLALDPSIHQVIDIYVVDIP